MPGKAEKEGHDPAWAPLYRAAGILTVVMLVLIPLQIAVFALSPHPVATEDWFRLFHHRPLLGLIHLDLLYIVNNLIVAFLYLAFFLSLREYAPALMAAALLLGLLGIASYFSSNKAIEMLALSKDYFAATDAAGKTAFLASGRNMLAEWKGTAFVIYYFLNGIALLLISLAMFRGGPYPRNTAVSGLISALLMMIPSTFGTAGLIFSLLSLIPWYVFSLLAAKILFRLPLDIREK